jgi:hypothetical protein
LQSRIKYTFEVIFWLWNFSACALAALLTATIDMTYGLLICLLVCKSTIYIDMNIMITNIIGMRFVGLRRCFHH